MINELKAKQFQTGKDIIYKPHDDLENLVKTWFYNFDESVRQSLIGISPSQENAKEVIDIWERIIYERESLKETIEAARKLNYNEVHRFIL